VKKNVFIFTMLISLSQFLYPQAVVINEFMSSNGTFLQDVEGDYSDWIEIYNSSDENINIENYMLSDDPELAEKWLFPSVEVPAKGFLLVFASGKNMVISGEIHTNFKLKQSGEFLYMSTPTGDLISLINPVSVPTDQSYGSITDGSEEMVIFLQATPNATNANGSIIYCSHESGFYANEFELNLIASNENIQIFYTLNGQIPSVNSSLYNGPILMTDVTETPNVFSNIPSTPTEGPMESGYYIWEEPGLAYKANVIRFVGFTEDGEQISNIENHTYFVDPDIYDRYDFPLVSIITDSLNLFQYDSGIYIPGAKHEEYGWLWMPIGNYHERGRDWEREIHISYFENNGDLGFETDAGMRIRGFGSSAFGQKSFGVYFRNDYGQKNIEYPIFSDALSDKYKRLVFRNSGNDFPQTHFKDAVLTSILKPMNFEYQRFRPSIVFINGEYWGIHNMREKYDDHYFDYQYNIKEDSLLMVGVCGEPDVGPTDEYWALYEYFVENDFSLDEHYDYAKTQMDIQNLIDYEIAEIYYANYDWPCNNYRMWKTIDPDSKWRYLIYDLDFSFAYNALTTFDTPSLEHATSDVDEWPTCQCSNIFFNKLLENEEFKEEFINRFAFHLETTFNKTRMLDSINSFKELLAPQMEEQFDRWLYPSSMSSWDYQIGKMINFAQYRSCYMRGHIMDFFGLDEFAYDCDDTATNQQDKANQISIIPNPSDGQNLRISLANNQKMTGIYQVMSLDGRVVTEGGLDSYHSSLNMSFLADGFYILKITVNNVHYSSKFIISK